MFRLTDAGREALARWHVEPAEIHETRDEGMLKLFFADALGGEATERALADMRDHHRAIAEQLRGIGSAKALERGDSKDAPCVSGSIGTSGSRLGASGNSPSCRKPID